MATKSSLTDKLYSKEYLAVCKSISVLIDLVKASPTTIAASLFAEGYVSPYQFDLVGPSSKMSDVEKAQLLVTAMTDRVKANPANFDALLALVRKEGTWVECYLAEVEKIYQVVNEESTREDSSDSDPYYSAVEGETSSDDDTIENYNKSVPSTGFVSPFCSKCSVKTFFSENGCPHAREQISSENNLRFPHLDCSSLTTEEKDILEARLLEDTEEIISHFADMENTLIDSLKSRRVDFKQLANYALNLIKKVEMKKERKQVKKAKSISEVFLALHPFKSFLHYEVVEKIALKFGSDQDRHTVKEYVSKFTKFCERSAFEVPPNIFHGTDQQPCDEMFCVFFTPEEFTSLGDVLSVRRKLAKILGIPLLSLRLHNIQRGSVKLNFLIPRKIAQNIFPLPKYKVQALEKAHIEVICQPSVKSADQTL